jgi:hypothetical protein
MTMPEAPVHEYRPSLRAIRYVRRACNVAIVNAVSQPGGVQISAYEKFRRRPMLSDATEPFRGRRIDQKLVAPRSLLC